MRRPQIVVLRRPECNQPGIIGKFMIEEPRMDGKSIIRYFWSLEKPWLDNQRGISAIPLGRYGVGKHCSGRFLAAYEKRWPGHGFVPILKGTKPRTFVLLHSANTQDQLRGCLALGSRYRDEPDKPKFLFDSRKAYKAVHDILVKLFDRDGDDNVFLEIRQTPECRDVK